MKLKTKKTLKKRIKITGSGKLMRKHIRTGHLKRKWSTNQKFRKQGHVAIKGRYKKKMKKLLKI